MKVPCVKKVWFLDLDGTLVDSNGVWDKIDRQLVKELGAQPDEETLLTLPSMTYERLYAFLTQNCGYGGTLQELKDHLDSLAVHEYAENIRAKPEGEELLRSVRETGAKAVLFTASPERLYRPVLEHNGLYDLFDGFICCDDIGLPKSDSGAYTAIARMYGTPPEDCALADDLPENLSAAEKAGFYTLRIYDKYSEADS